MKILFPSFIFLLLISIAHARRPHNNMQPQHQQAQGQPQPQPAQQQGQPGQRPGQSQVQQPQQAQRYGQPQPVPGQPQQVAQQPHSHRGGPSFTLQGQQFGGRPPQFQAPPPPPPEPPQPEESPYGSADGMSSQGDSSYNNDIPPDAPGQTMSISDQKSNHEPLMMTEEEMEEKVGEMVYEVLELAAEENHHHGGGNSLRFINSCNSSILVYCLCLTLVHIYPPNVY